MARPPVPLPRYARPGGYSVTSAAANPFAPTLDMAGADAAGTRGPSSLLELLMQTIGQDQTSREIDNRTRTAIQGGDPLAPPPVDTVNPYEPSGGMVGAVLGEDNPVSQWVGDNRNLLQGFGAALLSDGMDFSRVPMYAALDTEQRQKAADWTAAESGKRKLLDVLSNYGDGYADIADALSSGVIDAREGYNLMFKRQAELRGQAEAEAKNRQYAQFITDPTLKQLVAAGAMDGAEAYKLEHPSANGGEWGTAIQPGVDAAGNLVPLRAAPGGGLSIAPMPDGVRYAPDALVGAKTNATVDAKTAAAARAALPGAQQAREVTDKALGEIRANADGMREWFSQAGIAPRGMMVMGGSPMGKFVAAAKNANSQAFMQARAMLKGGGQITDYEGRRAEDAYSRMQAAMDSGDQEQYLRAVADFEDAVISGYNKLVATAQGDYSAGGGGINGGYGGTDFKSKYGLE